MKVLFKKRWHGIPIGIASIVLALMLVGGGVLASYNVFVGNANVTVVESITVTNTTGDGGEAFTGAAGNYAWDVSIYPGQTKTLCVLVSNASPNAVSIGITGVVTDGLTGGWSGGGGSVAGNSSAVLTLTVTADEDAYPGERIIYFEIFRG